MKTVTIAKRPHLLVSGAWLAQAAAWFLPVVTRIGGGRIDPVRGWQAFLIAGSAAWDGNSWYVKVLATLSVVTTLLFVIGSPWVMMRGGCSVRHFSAWAAAVAFVLNAHWLLWTDGWISDLGIGYFLWWWSFILLAKGLFDLARENDAAAAAHTQAAIPT